MPVVEILVGVVAVGAGVSLVNALARWRRQRSRPAPETLVMALPEDVTASRLPDGSIEIAWSVAARTVTIYAGAAPCAIERGAPVACSADGARVIIPPLEMTRPYFEVVFDAGTADERRLMVAERVLPLPSAPNFRDLGGYPAADGRRVRWGQVYRAGALSDLSDNDLRRLEALGVRLVCDLRSNEEVAEGTDRLPSSATYVHMPVVTTTSSSVNRERLRALLFNQALLGTMMVEFYTATMIDRNGQLFRAIFEQLADPANRPAVVHCTAGKDRAGVTAALLLLALGVPEDIVVADYSLSNRYYAHFRAITQRSVRPLAALGVRMDDLYPLLIANPDNLRATLDYIRARYGSLDSYLRDQAGIDDALIARLRDTLLE